MSSPLAVAAATEVLRARLDSALVGADFGAVLGTVEVSALPPDRVVPTGTSEPAQLNLFMYRATPNPGWSNRTFAARDSGGDRIANPPLALDLHYLLTAYGSAQLHADLLLGWAMHQLHETPFIDRGEIRNALQSAGGGGEPDPLLTLLGGADLDSQIEQLRITPEPLTSEEISRLWSSFQTHYRASSAYQVGVVLLERHRSTRRAPLVAERGLHVRQLRHPHIDALQPDVLEDSGRLTIEGYNLKADPVRLNFVHAFVTPLETNVSDDAIVVDLPTGLPAGVNSVQVIHDLDFGTANEPHAGFESNAAIFLLRPGITPGTVTGGIGPSNAGTLAVTFDPPVGKRQRVVLMLNEFNAPSMRPPRAYSFETPSRSQDSEPDTRTSLDLPFEGVESGDYLVRVQVDGAESALEMVESDVYNHPQVTIP